MSNGNFTNGSLVMRIWRFDGGVEMMAKFQYFSDAVAFGEMLLTRDKERGANENCSYFYMAVCDYEGKAQAIIPEGFRK
jgi:hypothetical protein